LKERISAIVACYRDEQAIPLMAERLTAVFERLGVDHEIIFVNDGSPDGSQAVLERLAAGDRRIKVITHSRNFGAHSAFTSGLRRATGQACVLLDGDLQDPPEVIESFHGKWRQGYEVVFGVRDRRDMSRARELVYKAFYRLLRRAAAVPVPVAAGRDSLLDRRVVDVFNAMPERDRFIQGLRAWIGFRQTGVRYVRPPRPFGRSTVSLWWNLRWARKGLFSFSYVPVELVWSAAAGLSALAAAAVLVEVVERVRRPGVPREAATILTACLVIGAVQLLGIAVVAEYLYRIFEEVKGRPHAVVAREIGFDA
jgi:glycosyltransferase involved in cell wall biosynthesis